MSQNYTPEFKKKIVRLREEEGRTYKSITAEYGVSTASPMWWTSLRGGGEFGKECQTDPQAKEEGYHGLCGGDTAGGGSRLPVSVCAGSEGLRGAAEEAGYAVEKSQEGTSYDVRSVTNQSRT